MNNNSNYNTYLGRLPDELYPIASVDGGDLLLISKKDLSIYYWFHEEDDWGIEEVSKWPTKICSNLKEYLNQLILLTPLTEAEIEESLKGCTVTITPTFVKIKNDIRAKEGLSPLTLEEWEKELNNSKR
ncbi:SMI1/KNR4 family protein [Myroides marinus]|uniref:SMI1/KNR4 family protein n=1 Tax=Myroides marinus TaxID=703342 RepID=UPI0033076372